MSDGPKAIIPQPVPSIGRIVLFHASLKGEEPLPAIITKVWSDQVVNLEVFGAPAGTKWPSSVVHESASWRKEDEQYWSWPPRV